MREIRLYHKIEYLSSGWVRFYYYNGEYNSYRNKLESYNRMIKNTDLKNIFAKFNGKITLILYFMNKIEYMKLMDQYNRYKKMKGTILNFKQSNNNPQSVKWSKAIRLKLEFDAWFKYNNFQLPV